MSELTEQEKSTLKGLHDQQRAVILGVCNVIGCADCHLKCQDFNGDDSCRSLMLQDEIMALEFKDCKP